jgi:hypothetical protein
MVATLLEHLVHQRFFTDVAASQVLDAHSSLFGQSLGILANLVPQRFGPASEVKDADAVEPQIPAHPIGVTDARQGATDHHPVQAGQFTSDFGGMPLSEKFHYRPPVLGLASLYQTALAS